MKFILATDSPFDYINSPDNGYAPNYSVLLFINYTLKGPFPFFSWIWTTPFYPTFELITTGSYLGSPIYSLNGIL